jgi:hypothetical protein
MLLANVFAQTERWPSAKPPRRWRRKARPTGSCRIRLYRQGNDVGTSYRSEIFYVSEAQRDEALRTIDDVNASGLWPGRGVTKVSPAGEFWEAEPEHQDYLERYPLGYTCHFPRPGWKLPRRAGAAA